MASLSSISSLSHPPGENDGQISDAQQVWPRDMAVYQVTSTNIILIIQRKKMNPLSLNFNQICLGKWKSTVNAKVGRLGIHVYYGKFHIYNIKIYWIMHLQLKCLCLSSLHFIQHYSHKPPRCKACNNFGIALSDALSLYYISP
jgi:hypothetical protein